MLAAAQHLGLLFAFMLAVAAAGGAVAWTWRRAPRIAVAVVLLLFVAGVGAGIYEHLTAPMSDRDAPECPGAPYAAC